MFSQIKNIVLRVILWFVILSVAWVAIYRFTPVPITYLMVQRIFEQKFNGKAVSLSKDWVAGEKISMNMKRAVIASEDQRFMDHWGFDFSAINKAFKRNQKNKRIRGGSTITQQVGKNVFLWPGRSWIRKGFEAYFTFLVELLWSKERIMTVYLNVIEMGDGIYGIEAAARIYFNKPATDLSKAEAALIAAILPNPLNWTPKQPNAYILKRQRSIITRMNKLPVPEL